MKKKIKKYLNELKENLIIKEYPPIYDINKKSYISQYEKTIYINETNNIILS